MTVFSWLHPGPVIHSAPAPLHHVQSSPHPPPRSLKYSLLHPLFPPFPSSSQSGKSNSPHGWIWIARVLLVRLKKSYNKREKGFKAKSNTPRIIVRNSPPHSLCPMSPHAQSPRTYWRPPPALPACCRAPEAQVAQRRRPSWLRLLCWWWSLSPPGPGCGLEKTVKWKEEIWNKKHTYPIYHNCTCIQ